MTSNIGSDLIRQDRGMGFANRSGDERGAEAAYDRMQNNVNEEVKRFFRPEFLNRIDGSVVFHALTRDHMLEIVDLMLADVSANLVEKGISLEVGREAKDWLADKGYDPTFGARPLRRVIQDNLEDKLSDAILMGDVNVGDTAVIEVEGDEIVVNVQSPLARWPLAQLGRAQLLDAGPQRANGRTPVCGSAVVLEWTAGEAIDHAQVQAQSPPSCATTAATRRPSGRAGAPRAPNGTRSPRCTLTQTAPAVAGPDLQQSSALRTFPGLDHRSAAHRAFAP